MGYRSNLQQKGRFVAISQKPQSEDAQASRHQPPPMAPYDFFLYVVAVLSWSASWYALKLQVGVVAVEVSLFWRFVLAAAIMFLWTIAIRAPMRFSLASHLKFVLMGLLMFCLNFILFYHASKWLASGLLSVVFSLASVFNIIIAMIFLNLRPSANTVIGAVLGFSGIVLMFWPVIAGQSFDQYAALGLGLCIVATLSFCTGNFISASLQRDNVPVISASAWGMAYGAGLSGLIALVGGNEFLIDWRPTYLASLAFLAVVSSVIAFAAYLTLLGRIGSHRAGYATVMFPVVALAISSVLEDYYFGVLASIGLVLVLAGNIFVLKRSKDV